MYFMVGWCWFGCGSVCVVGVVWGGCVEQPMHGLSERERASATSDGRWPTPHVQNQSSGHGTPIDRRMRAVRGEDSVLAAVRVADKGANTTKPNQMRGRSSSAPPASVFKFFGEGPRPLAFLFFVL